MKEQRDLQDPYTAKNCWQSFVIENLLPAIQLCLHVFPSFDRGRPREYIYSLLESLNIFRKYLVWQLIHPFARGQLLLSIIIRKT